jgi:hypothetical protein
VDARAPALRARFDLQAATELLGSSRMDEVPTPSAAWARLGYLLKDRVDDVEVVIDALTRVTAGECVVDPPSSVDSCLPLPRTQRPRHPDPSGTRGAGPNGGGTLQHRHRCPAEP